MPPNVGSLSRVPTSPSELRGLLRAAEIGLGLAVKVRADLPHGAGCDSTLGTRCGLDPSHSHPCQAQPTSVRGKLRSPVVGPGWPPNRTSPVLYCMDKPPALHPADPGSLILVPQGPLNQRQVISFQVYFPIFWGRRTRETRCKELKC